MPLQFYLLIGFLVLFMGGIALIVLFGFLEGWWLSRQSVPSRFKKLKNESDFDQSALPEITQKLGMTQADQIPMVLHNESEGGFDARVLGSAFTVFAVVLLGVVDVEQNQIINTKRRTQAFFILA
jgi:hypothetical protein